MTMILPRKSIGQTQPDRNPSLLVRDAIIMTLYEKALEVSWWMLCLGRSRGQNPRGLRPLGFWPCNLPRHNIHHDTSSAFSNNVPVYQNLKYVTTHCRAGTINYVQWIGTFSCLDIMKIVFCMQHFWYIVGIKYFFKGQGWPPEFQYCLYVRLVSEHIFSWA